MWNHFWATFIDIWRFFTGHTGQKEHLLRHKCGSKCISVNDHSSRPRFDPLRRSVAHSTEQLLLPSHKDSKYSLTYWSEVWVSCLTGLESSQQVHLFLVLTYAKLLKFKLVDRNGQLYTESSTWKKWLFGTFLASTKNGKNWLFPILFTFCAEKSPNLFLIDWQ